MGARSTRSPRMSCGSGAASPPTLRAGPCPAPPKVTGARQEALRIRLQELGFDQVGFVRLDRRPAGDGLRAWLGAGFHADMGWMARAAEKRLDPGLVLDGARSAILLGIDYFRGKEAGDGPHEAAGNRGPVWARYA